MKLLKSRTLTLLVLLAFLVTFTLGMVYAFPSRSATAEEGVEAPAAEEIVYTNTVHVSSEEKLKEALEKADTTPTKIILDGSIEMKISSGSKDWQRWYDITVNRKQVIEIDLAGHILSAAPMSHGTKPVIYNYGTLSIVDSSGDYSGAVVSNGYIHEVGGKYDWDSSRTVIENHGALTVDANIRINCPRPTKVGTNGYFNTFGSAGDYIDGPKISNVYLIYNEFVAPTSKDEEDDKWKELIYPTSLTINGGTFDLTFSKQIKNDLPPMEHFFLLRDTDLTVNGGTFRNSGQRKPWYVGGFLADIQTVSGIYYQYSYGKYASYFKDIYHIDVKIAGGDFSDKYLLGGDSDTIGLIYTGDYIVQDGKEADEYEIFISGGTFPLDLSVYTDAQHMMKENDDGTYSVIAVEDDYIQEYAVAKLMLDGDEPTLNGYYGSFEGAWGAAKTLAKMGQSTIIQLLKDTESKILYLEGVKKDVSITMDLNGKELKISVEGQDAYNAFIYADNSTSEPGVITLTVCDKTEGQNGAINFVYPDKYDKYGSIMITEHVRFVLESGTLKRTGGGFNWGQNSSNEHRKSIFYLNDDGAYNVNAVTIKGGNILSMLSGGDQGHLIARASDNNHSQESYWESLERYVDDLTLNLDEYLGDSPEKGCQFSWDLSSIIPNGPDGPKYRCAKDKNTNTYYVSLVGENKYSVGMQSFSSLNAALEATTDGSKTVLMIAPDTLTEGVTLDGVTLDLNVYQNFTLQVTGGLTLKNGAAVKNGTIAGNVTVEGSASFANFKLNGDLDVKNTAVLKITEGTYNGTVTVEGGADLSISGGSFKGSQVSTIETYLPKYYGMFKPMAESYADDTLYPVRIAPNKAVQEWYTTFITNYTINSAADWNNFALVVSSGADNFSGKMIKLGQNIDFSQSTQGIALYGATATEPNFLPAGTNAYRFAGSFDGQGNTMSGIYAQEINVGLFGATAYGAYVRVMNVTVKDSTFIVGKGILDSLNENATPVGGAIVGEGHLDAGKTEDDQWSGNITLNGVTVGHSDSYSYCFIGGVLGHSWGSVYLDGLKIRNKTTLQNGWKAGGVVGYLDGEFYIKKADIEQGKEPDGSDNGLILGGGSCCGALVGHANGSKNTIENCTVLEPNDSLIGSTYAGGVNSKITIKGAQTDLDIFQVVGEGRGPKSNTVIELTSEVTEEGVSKGSFKTQKAEDYLTFTDGDGNEVEVERNPGGDGFSVEADILVTVVVYDITVGPFTYGDKTTVEATSFKLRTAEGIEMSALEGLTVTVTLEKSNYNVGNQVALITSIALGGEAAGDYTLATVGNQAFIEVEVVRTTLYVGVDPQGNVTYDGFVNGDTEDVLSGTLTFERHGNVVTPGGLTSENYNIVFVSGIVTKDGGTDLTALWITLAALAVAGMVVGCVAVTRRKKQ